MSAGKGGATSPIEERSHALLSASGADRWMHCTPSARLEDQFPDTGSEAAAEGTLAHAIAELKVRKKFVEPMGTRTYNARMKKLQADPLYQEEMQRHTDAYLDYITERCLSYPAAPFVAVERRVDLSAFVPGGFGTSDCIILAGNTLHVIDFKYGKGVTVQAEENPQLRLYGLGALLAYSSFYDVKTVEMTIFQPRRDNISSERLSRDALLNWGAFEVKPKAKLAAAGEGEQIPGPWCKFCRAMPVCRRMAGELMLLEEPAKSDPRLLTEREVGEYLTRGERVVDWYKSLERYALAACLEGKEIPGYKAVEGRSNRAFDDVDRAFDHLMAAGYDEALLYTRKPITLTETEKLLGKTKFDQLLAGHVVKPKGKPTLAPESDPREPYRQDTAASDFAEVVNTER